VNGSRPALASSAVRVRLTRAGRDERANRRSDLRQVSLVAARATRGGAGVRWRGPRASSSGSSGLVRPGGGVRTNGRGAFVAPALPGRAEASEHGRSTRPLGRLTAGGRS